jgi:hypothetical protein
LSFLCPCGKRIALKALGCCRSCYDRRHHSLRFFGGLRERVLERDRFCCRGCGKRSALVVHYWFSKMLARLWRELHPNAPMQLELTFRNVEKKENSKAVCEEMTEKVLLLLALSNAHAPELWRYSRPGGIESHAETRG